MWARVVEVMLGCWLLVSPFVFAHPGDRPEWWINDFATGFVVIALGLLSFWHKTRNTHLLQIASGIWLIGFAYTHIGHPPPAAQNNALTGWLLLMFAIIPNLASRPPKVFDREFHEASGY